MGPLVAQSAAANAFARVVSAVANVITNGTFASDTIWSGTGYSGKSISGGKANFVASPTYDDINQPVTVTAGKYYELVWTVSGWTSGSVFPQLSGGTTVTGTSRTANGTYTQRMLVATGNTTFRFMLDVAGTLSVSNLSFTGPYTTATVGGA